MAKPSRDPVITLSPGSPAQSPLSPCSPSQTTPKLPRRERAASFSRLLTSDKYLELLPSHQRGAGSRTSKARRMTISGKDSPSICVTPCSPTSADDGRKASAEDDEKGVLDSQQLPFSPRLLMINSPNYLSPHYVRPTPTRSPLYSVQPKSSFLGRGSFGNVTLCVHRDSKFALKVARRRSSSLGECNMLEVRHPHLVRVLHVNHVVDKVLVFMEFAGHCNLQQLLDTKSELDFQKRLGFCIQTLHGLRHCHKNNIVHADVKPANVIVSPHGICKLCDFGLSFKSDSVVASELPEDAIGTAAYTAPEVLKGGHPTTMSDVYSFGVLLWQVHSREVPFQHEHPHVIIYKVAQYGARPVFNCIEDRFVERYSVVAQKCWKTAPEERLDATQTLSMLQGISTDMKRLKAS